MSTSLEVVAVVKQIVINRKELAIEDYPIEFTGTDNPLVVNSVVPQTFTEAKTDVTIFGDYNIFEYSVNDFFQTETNIVVNDTVNETLTFASPGIIIPVTSSIKGTEIVPFSTTSKDIWINYSYDAPVAIVSDDLGDSSTSEINFSASTTYSIKVGLSSAIDLLYTTPGNYQYTVPAGVSSMSAVAVGGGGGGSPTWANSSGGGGGLAWNNFPVSEGDVLNITVGAGGLPGTRGSNNASAGGNSFIKLIKYDPNYTPPPQLYTFTDATFKPGGATGQTGPTLAQAQSGITSTGNSDWKNNTSYFNVTDGIQYWTVPVTGSYTITAKGAQGGLGGTLGGRGAIITGTFNLTEGEIIRILVGQQGLTGGHSQNTSTPVASGGGGSYVIRSPYNATASILVIAGGGGGGANNSWGNSSGIDAVATENGTAGRGNDADGAGGVNGNGGTGVYGGAGAGFFGNGSVPSGTPSGDVSKSFINGGAGGRNARSWGGPEIYGGFGGGGGGGGLAAGGGGGYSGGGAGLWASAQGGGGGGSYNNGTDKSSTVGQHTGDGEVIITYNEIVEDTVIKAYGGGNASSNADTNGPNKNGYGGGYEYIDYSDSIDNFNYVADADQTYVVPQDVTSISVKMWGAGGGSNRDAGAGGGGGYSSGDIAVTPGETLTIRVGRGGQGGGQSDNETVSVQDSNTRLNGGAGGWPGGGTGGTLTSYGGGGGGGGYTGIFRGSTPLIIAGGGGGGGDDASGAAGGGTSGANANGNGGTQSAGGSSGATPITPSGYLQGASGGSGTIGGGGGGGYYGGGAGGIYSGGGGGSGYIDGPGVTNGTTTTGSGTNPGNNTDSSRGIAGQGAPAGATGENSTSTYLGIKGINGKLIIEIPLLISGGGGAGGNATNYQGGGGAGGYTGNGGNQGANPATGSGGGAGGRYYSSTYGSGAGGGVGIYGRGADGVISTNTGGGGGGGSGGTAGLDGEMAGTQGQSTDASINGGLYGGGAGGAGTTRGGGSGGSGAVRLISGGNRSFPDDAGEMSSAQSAGPTEFSTNITYTTYEKPYIETTSEKSIYVELKQTTVDYFNNYEPTFKINSEKTVYTERNLSLNSSRVVNVQEQGIQVNIDRDKIEQTIASKDIMTSLNDLTYNLIKIVPTNISISVRDDQELGYFINPDGSAAFAVLNESNDPRAVQIPSSVGPTQRWF